MSILTNTYKFCVMFIRPEYKCIQQKPDLKCANYQLILPIRVMQLKKSDLKKYRTFMILQSHVEDRAGTQTETTVREKVVRILEHYK